MKLSEALLSYVTIFFLGLTTISAEIVIKDDNGRVLADRLLLDVGASLTLRCENTFPAGADYVPYLPQWNKCQYEFEFDGTSTCSETEVSDHNAALDQFLTHAVTDSGQTNNIRFNTVTFNGLRTTDSGWYMCKDSTQHEIIQVFVREQTNRMEVSVSRVGSTNNNNTEINPQTVSVQARETIDYSCKVFGGVPRPEVLVEIDGTRMTNGHELASARDVLHRTGEVYYDRNGAIVNYEVMLEEDVPDNYGSIEYVMEWRSQLVVKPEHNGEKIDCFSRIAIGIDGSESWSAKTVRTGLSVIWDPVLENCFGEDLAREGIDGFRMQDGVTVISAQIGDDNVRMRCTVSANPQPDEIILTAMRDVLQITQTERTSLDIALDSLALESGNGNNVTFEVIFPTLQDEHFQQYSFRVVNAIGPNAKQFRFDYSDGRSFYNPSNEEVRSGVCCTSASMATLLVVVTLTYVCNVLFNH